MNREVFGLSDSEPRSIRPDFDKAGGLIPAIAQDEATGEILMLAYMNPAALDATIQTGEVHYYSRSRQTLWHKGGTSGHVQKVKDIRLDCDGDAVVVKIEQVGGAACHTGHRSCFHYAYQDGQFAATGVKAFDPRKVYGS
jgi:phosphoribosyl-AMP cyclohydrolase